MVAKNFGQLTTDQVIQTSHLESAWIKNEQAKSLISYQDYAFELKGLAFEDFESIKESDLTLA